MGVLSGVAPALAPLPDLAPTSAPAGFFASGLVVDFGGLEYASIANTVVVADELELLSRLTTLNFDAT